MVKIKLPEGRANGTVEFAQFRGVDFSATPGEVKPYRSPDAVNMISDVSGRPVKRYGYERIREFPGRINGIFKLVKDLDILIVHAGDSLYSWEGELMYSGMADERSSAFQMEGSLWILDGRRLLCFDGNTVVPADTIAYVPTTRIGGKPGDYGGEQYEERNLLSPCAINTFVGDGTGKEYYINTINIVSVDRVELMDAEGEWETVSGYTTNLAKGTLTFDTAPPKPPVRGEDNVRVTFTKPIEGSIDKINKCRFGIQWGIGGNNRMVIAGNPDYPNMDFTTEISNPKTPGPTYFPELNYSLVGQETSAIMGYQRMGGGLVILKESNEQDATVFMRTAELSSAFEIMLFTREGVVGVGAVSPYSMGELRDEPMFLTRQGVYALTESGINEKRYAQMRSGLVNKRLCAEPNMGEAVAVEYNDFFMVALNGHVYVADAAQQTATSRETGQYQYEWYYWSNIPARVWYKQDGFLWFGTGDGKIMRFYNRVSQYSFNDDGKPIFARWTTPELSLGTYSRFKTLQRLYAKLTPYGRSSVKIYVKEDGGWQLELEKNADIFDWWHLDFRRFTFNTDRDVFVIYTRLRKKRVISTQIRLENGELNEHFGLTGMTLYYDVKSKVK